MLIPVISQLLIGSDCPSDMYMEEEVRCYIIVSSTKPDSYLLSLYFAEGKGTVYPTELEVSASSTPSFYEITVWSSDAGKDALIVNYKKDAYVKNVVFHVPPVVVYYPHVTANPGKRSSFDIRVSGEADNVVITFETPDILVVEPDRIDVGYLEGEKTYTVYISPSLSALGTYETEMLISFTDERGYHTIRKRVQVTVTPDITTLALVGLILLALVGIFYVMWRKKSETST